MDFFNKRYHPAGTAPGTLIEASPENALPLRVRLVDYDANEIVIKDDVSASDCKPYWDRDTITWVHVQGSPDERALRELGATFGLHALALEDVLNIGQRPKVDRFNDQLFVIMSLPIIEGGRVAVHQVSLFLGEHHLISFCEADVAAFEPIVQRLQARGSRMRTRDADYLMYGLLDVIIDQAFPLLEDYGLRLEELEEQIIENADHGTLPQIHRIKRELIILRRNLWPQREVVNELLRTDSPLIRDQTGVYLRDCYDHTIQVMDLLETYREMVSSMLDIYLSSVSNRMNQVMRVLTVIATIFIPLTFIVGVYGMNFDRNAGPWNMPELGEPLGYLSVWLIMIAIAVAMVIFFRSRKWF